MSPQMRSRDTKAVPRVTACDICYAKEIGFCAADLVVVDQSLTVRNVNQDFERKKRMFSTGQD